MRSKQLRQKDLNSIDGKLVESDRQMKDTGDDKNLHAMWPGELKRQMSIIKFFSCLSYNVI